MSDPEATIYVGNIDTKVTKELLYELFTQVGQVKKVKYPKDKISQEYQGFAFIEFFSTADADYVLNVMNNNVKLYQKVLKIRRSNQAVQKDDTNKKHELDASLLPVAKVFVKDIADTVEVRHLAQLFSKFGPLAKTPEVFTVSNGEVRCAFIYFKFYDNADLAIQTLNGQFIMNKKASLEYAFKENGRKNLRYGTEADRILNKEARKNGILK